MKKENMSLLLSCIAMSLSVASSCYCFFKADRLSFDILSFVVCFATLVITIYISVQVIQSMTLKKEIDKMLENNNASIVKATNKIIDQRIEDYDHHVNSLVYAALGSNEIYAIGRAKFEQSFINLIKSLDEMNQSSKKDGLEQVIQDIQVVLSLQSNNSLQDFIIKKAIKALSPHIEKYSYITDMINSISQIKRK